MTAAERPLEHPLAAPARAWFETLRDRLCAAFEAIEDELDAGPHAALPPGRFERTAWDRPSETGQGGGGVMSVLRGGRDVVLAARFRLAKDADPVLLGRERERILAWRRARHPDWRSVPCAGSFFRNVEPVSTAGRRQAAGWFLEQAGASSMRVGGAAVFPRHANILIKADPACTAQDVYDLSVRMAAAVRERFGLELVREVETVGSFRDA